MNFDPQLQFQQERDAEITRMANDADFADLSNRWMQRSIQHRYSYNFTWLGRPIIQYPQDLVAMQEVLWTVRPQLVIETGVAHGGSLIFYASILELLGEGRVLGIDIDIREHNRQAIEAHPMFSRIDLLQGSSISPSILEEVSRRVQGVGPVLVCLDSNHTHDHVLEELHRYADFVSVGSYLVVFDTIVEYLPADSNGQRPWGPGDNPWTAVQRFLELRDDFALDSRLESKLCLSVAPGGYLRRVR